MTTPTRLLSLLGFAWLVLVCLDAAIATGRGQQLTEEAIRERAAAHARYSEVEKRLYGGKLQSGSQLERATTEDCARALDHVRFLQRQGAGKLAGIDDALNEIARVHVHSMEYDRAEPLLLEVVRDYPEQRSAARAMLKLGELNGLKGDQKKQEDWLLRASKTSKSGDLMYGGANEAMLRLALLYEGQERWKDALKYWPEYKAHTGCGTCNEGIEANKARHIAWCHAHLNDHASAAKLLWQFLTGPGLGGSSYLAADLFVLYEQAGQLDHLFASVQAHEDLFVAAMEKAGNGRERSRRDLLKYAATESLHQMKRNQELALKRHAKKLESILNQGETGIKTIQALGVGERETDSFRRAVDRWLPYPSAKPGSLPKELPSPVTQWRPDF
jgi:hypothetical protein